MTPSRTTPLLFPNTPLSDMSLNSDIDFAAGGTPWGHRSSSTGPAATASSTPHGGAAIHAQASEGTGSLIGTPTSSRARTPSAHLETDNLMNHNAALV